MTTTTPAFNPCHLRTLARWSLETGLGRGHTYRVATRGMGALDRARVALFLLTH